MKNCLWRVLAVVSVVVAASSCSLFDSKTPRTPARLADLKSTLGVKVLWSVKPLSKKTSYALQPATVDGLLIAALPDDSLNAYEVNTGKLRWRINTGFAISAGVAVNEGLAVVAGAKGEVLAVNASDGGVRWKTRINAEAFGVPLISRGVVVVRSSDARLVGFSADKGEQRWTLQRQLPPLVVRLESNLLALGETFLAGMPNGRLLVVNTSDGTVRFDLPIAQPRGSTELERMADVIGPLALVTPDLCAASYQSKVTCLNIQTGAVSWTRDFSAMNGVGADSRYVFAVDTLSHVYALSRSNGAPAWQNKRLQYRRLTSPLSWGGTTVVADEQGLVHFLAREDGSFVARLNTDNSGVVTSPVVVDQTAFNGLVVQTHAGGLYAIGNP